MICSGVFSPHDKREFNFPLRMSFNQNYEKCGLILYDWDQAALCDELSFRLEAVRYDAG